MAQITQKVQYLLYTGAGGSLAGADFLSHVQRICKPSANGQGQISYLPGAQFPPFSTLENNTIYLVFSSTVPYEIPTTAAKIQPELGELSLLSTLFTT